MTVFDHRDLGTSEASWAADERLTGANPLPLPRTNSHLVVLAAHPDDETLGAGGLIASAARRGARVELIVASDGEASHPASSTHTPRELATRRRAEVVEAMVTLDRAATVTQLGLPDGLLNRHLQTIEQAIDHALRPGSLLLTPWQGDRHSDHAACAQAAANVLRRRPDAEHWQYPIWAWHWADPSDAPWDWEDVARLDLDPQARAAKQAAIAHHHSQNQPLSELEGDEAILSESFLAHFRRPYETFLIDPRAARARASHLASGVSA